ncbi:MAG TPA: lysophospholipid acyltransferase family protein [Fibrobacteria bacterium]|nr:lysophospholipid acyltransferase family protein [Fibrobacteria bacterium]
MILRVIKVLWFMFNRLWIYGWLRLIRSEHLEARLLKDFRNWSAYVLQVFGVDLEVSGRAHVPVAPGRKIIIMSNHQSQLDIPALTRAMDRLAGFVAKRELSRIPLLNYWMRQLGCVIIDRSDKRGAHQALEKAAREMGSTPLVVFPEGTRSRDGRLLPFKLGGTRLALLAHAIIVPALIEGSRDAVENRKTRGKGPIPVRLTFFPPLDTQGMDEGKASQNKIKDYVEQCWRSPNAPT